MAKFIVYFEGDEKALNEAIKTVKGLTLCGRLQIAKTSGDKPIYKLSDPAPMTFTQELKNVIKGDDGQFKSTMVPVKFQIAPNTGVFFWVSRVGETVKDALNEAELLASAKVR